MPEPAHTRIGHAERDRAVEQLREAAALGRIDLDELEERVEAALGARTQSELSVVLADLIPASGPGGHPALRGPDVPALGYAPDSPLVLAAGSGSVKRRGPWELPGWIRVIPALGSVRIDCREATARYRVVDIELVPSAGSVVLILPRGWAADVDRVGRGIGTVTSKVAAVPSDGAPVLVLRGSVGLGSVKVRHENRWERWRSTRTARGSTGSQPT